MTQIWVETQILKTRPRADLPIDENHPPRPTETYGLSKVVGEEIGRMIARTSATTGGCGRRSCTAVESAIF